MKNYLRVLFTLAVLIGVNLSMLEVADASEAKLDDDYTLGEIESILFDYFKESTLDYEIGSIELRDYLLNQLLYDEDNN